jgi:hypothetical protein
MLYKKISFWTQTYEHLKTNCPMYEKCVDHCLLGLFFEHEDGGNVFLKNISKVLLGYTAPITS